MVGIWPKILQSLLLLLFVSFGTILSGCRDQKDTTANLFSEQSRQCLSCHKIELDSSHRFDCNSCHLQADTQYSDEDHPAVLAAPAHPDYAEKTCGTCHEQQLEMVADNDHYLFRDHLKLVTEAFGIELEGIDGTPKTLLSSHPAPENAEQLVEDLLVRRCFRCHLFYEGDEFSAVSRGKGCAACHLSFREGQLSSHTFLGQPGDERCLSCHYANHVGFDYYGRYEHDLNEEYRTPYMADAPESPPYGVEYHNLAPDVHQRAGMVCVDCHRQSNVMGRAESIQCVDCHLHETAELNPDLLVVSQDDEVMYVPIATSESLPIPQIKHPAHNRYGKRISCQACHAQWTYNDAPTHLLRIDHEEFDDFYKLSLDGSSEVLRIVSSHILYDGDLLEPFMSNKFSGVDWPGIWFRGFGERRWEQVLLDRDDSGRVTTVRPILDLRLSWIDADEESRFDNLEPLAGIKRSIPYAPHTIGRAGLFYEARIQPFLTSEEKN